MPVLPEYRATQAPGANAQNFLNAYEQTSSLMERKQRLAMAQEQQSMEKAKFQAYLPAILAKGQADRDSAAASIANTTRMEALRAQAAQSSTDYNDRFLNIMTIPDDKDRSDTLGAFMGEVSWLNNPALPEYQRFAKTVMDERAKAFTMAATNLKLDQHLEELNATIEGRKAVAQTNVAGRIETAGIRAGAQERIKAIDSDTKLSIADKQAQKGAIAVEGLVTRAAEADQLAADESAAGNEVAAQAHREVAARYRDALTKTTTFAGATPSAPRTKEQDVKPTPKTETRSPDLTFMGKSLAPKLYVVDETTKTPTFAPDVKTPAQILGAVQQMIDDGVVTPEEGRATLTRLGFKPKK